MDNKTLWVASADEEPEGTHMRKGPWTVEEDMELIRYISLHGEGRWSFLAKAAGLNRTGKSCRMRWVNYLRPNLKRSKISPEEERLIVELHGRFGNRWSRIAQSLPGRTDNEIKNYWRTRIEKKINTQDESGSSGMGAGNRVNIEHSMVSCCITASSQRPSDLVIAEPSTSLQGKTTEEIRFQTRATSYLQDDISPQVIPISEGNCENGGRGEVQGPRQVNDDRQPGAASLDYFKGLDNQLSDNSLRYNFSVGSFSSLLYFSEFSADDATEDGITPPSSSYMVDSPEAFLDSEFLNRYSDVLWNMDE